MKTRFLGFLCTALFAAGILLGAATASAHGMTYWEATLVLDDMVMGGQNQLEPRKSTLGDARRAIVHAELADDYQKWTSVGRARPASTSLDPRDRRATVYISA